MIQRLLAMLLHYANASGAGLEFYALKGWLLERYAQRDGEDVQEIVKKCWGPGDWYDPESPVKGCPGEGCKHCGGSGIYDRKITVLNRWRWCGYVFHTIGTWPPKQQATITIRGYVRHEQYGMKAVEARIWLYVLCGEWRMFWREISGHRYLGWYCWPMLNVARVLSVIINHWPRRFECWCGRRYWKTWTSGWCICPKCRRESDRRAAEWKAAMAAGQ